MTEPQPTTADPAVLYDKRPDGVAVITFNRPERMNAISSGVKRGLVELIGDAAHDDGVRCVVLTGAGRAFCAGADVRRLADTAAASSGGAAGTARRDLATEVRELRDFQMRTIHLLHTMGKPTIAAVNGHAIGAGFAFALACDLRIVSASASFGTGFGRIAVSGDTGASWFLQRLVGPAKAYELFLTGETIPADEALRLGIANRVLADERFLDQVTEFAARLAAGPPLAFARMKESFQLGERSDLRTILDQEATSILLSLRTEDHAIAIAALTAGTSPRFVGR